MDNVQNFICINVCIYLLNCNWALARRQYIYIYYLLYLLLYFRKP
jgi:hypothetical protein